MAQWYATCHGNAVNLDMARQVFVKQGHDGLYRVVAELVISLQSGESVDYSLESGYATEEAALDAMRSIVGPPPSEPSFGIRQVETARPRSRTARARG